jgi:uncharacterized protein (TIRG00374 family)
VFGLAAFGYLVWRFGFDQILSNIEKAGWSLFYVILVWCGIYLLNTLAWKLVLGDHGRQVKFSTLFMVTVSGFVLNYITPVVALGGEPYKVKALGTLMDTKRALSAVVLYRMVHLLGHMLLLLTGVVAALAFLSLPLSLNMLLGLIGVLILSVILLTLLGHRDGVFERLKNFLDRFRLLRRLSAGLQHYEDNLTEMDHVITDVYRNQRSQYYFSIIVEYMSRALMGVEVYLILRGIGVDVTIASALFLYVSYSIIINLLFFIPMNLGAREGGLVLGLESLALPPLLGVYLGVVMRIREFFWILLGLLFILIAAHKQKIHQTEAL